MADVTVGVKRATVGGAEVTQQWVQVGDVRLTANDHGLLDVQYGTLEAGWFSVVTIRLLPTSFASVAAEEPAHTPAAGQ